MRSHPLPSPSLVATSTALPFRCRNWLAVTLTAKVSAACTSWQKTVKETTEAGIFFQKLSPSLLQHVSYQKSSPVNHPSAALLALLHTGTAALYALPLENVHLRTRHNTSLNKGQVSTQKFSRTTARHLCRSVPGCFSPARPTSQLGHLCLRVALCPWEG